MTVGESIERQDKDDFYAKVDDQDYWELAYLQLLKRDEFRFGAIVFLVVAAIAVAVLAVTIGTTTGWERVLLAVIALANIGMALAMSFFSWAQWMKLDSVVRRDNRAGRRALREFAERVRRFALRQEQEFGFIVKIEGWYPGRGDRRQEWALDHARTILTEWPRDFAEYQDLQSNVDYQRVRSYLFDRPDLKHGEGTVLFEAIMRSRQDMWERVQRSLKRERAASAIERDKTIGVHEETTRAEINDLADRFKKQRSNGEDEDD